MGTGSHGPRHICHGQSGDGHARGRSPRGRAVLIILLYNQAILGDAGQLDVGESHPAHRARGLVHRFDSNAVGGVAHGGLGDSHVLNDIVVATANRADRQAMATRTGSTAEVNVLHDEKEEGRSPPPS